MGKTFRLNSNLDCTNPEAGTSHIKLFLPGHLFEVSFLCTRKK